MENKNAPNNMILDSHYFVGNGTDAENIITQNNKISSKQTAQTHVLNLNKINIDDEKKILKTFNITKDTLLHKINTAIGTLIIHNMPDDDNLTQRYDYCSEEIKIGKKGSIKMLNIGFDAEWQEIEKKNYIL